MKNIWFITNVGSGTATAEKCAALEALFATHGLALAGRTRFPDDDIPDPARLDEHGVDTVVLFAGDGTINAALCALDGWHGDFLILPGGTMNLLAIGLHGRQSPEAIVEAARQGGRRIALPYVEAGNHRGFVGAIIGPAASWVHAREAARDRNFGRALGAMRRAWQRTFGKGVRLAGAAGLRDSYQAVYVMPSTGGLDVAAINARDWRSIAELGWAFLSGDWVSARSVETVAATRLRITRPPRILGLFDGEPALLEAGTEITAGRSRPCFIATAAGEEQSR